MIVDLNNSMVFLSTPSARRATTFSGTAHYNQSISIHALREEGDEIRGCHRCCDGCISIHALREEGDKTAPITAKSFGIFLSTPSARRATAVKAMLDMTGVFLSTPSARRAT